MHAQGISTSEWYAVVLAPIGRLGLRGTDRELTAVDFLPADAPLRLPEVALARAAAAQLEQYFRDPRTEFRLPLALPGTLFQQRVWAALRAIPPGAMRTYGELARELGSAARAVGGACRANPIPVIVPCHRVVGQAGHGGYCGTVAGELMELKRWLLAHEGMLLFR